MNTGRTCNGLVNTSETCNKSLIRSEVVQTNMSDRSTMDNIMFNSIDIDQPPTTVHTGTSQTTSCLSDLSHPSFRDYQDRLKSYTKWPQHEMQRPEILAKSGLFYTGNMLLHTCLLLHIYGWLIFI